VNPAVSVSRLWLERFRGIDALDLELGPGLTVFVGSNAQGKTTLLEAVSWVARRRSLRGVADHVLIQAGWDQAIVRAEVLAGERVQLFEAELNRAGRNRIRLNSTAVARRRDLFDLVRVSVFAPDDLDLVKAGPSHRRDYLDELLGSLAARYDAARADYERVVKHRNALLRAGVRRDDEATLEIFDEQLVVAGTELLRGRLKLLDQLRPQVAATYLRLAGCDMAVACDYSCEWTDAPLDEDATTLAAALREAITRRRSRELDRRMTLVGPHRDDITLSLDGHEARTTASQGEQRTLALALRLAGHEVVTAITGVAPVLLLDDVFSELDDDRAHALVANLPVSQTLLTSTGHLPHSVRSDRTFRVVAGKVVG
jgi:DNA replication and repair protein RecF